jgi:hypothetical protein
MYEIYVDGQFWIDSEGNTEWPHHEAIALCGVLESQGYKRVSIVRV